MQLDVLARMDVILSNLQGLPVPDNYQPMRFKNYNLDVLIRLDAILATMNNAPFEMIIINNTNHIIIDEYRKVYYFYYTYGDSTFTIDIDLDLLQDMKDIMHIVVFAQSATTLIGSAYVNYKDGNDYMDIAADEVGELSLLPFPMPQTPLLPPQFSIKGIWG
jgi:hypothetical protein